MITERKDVDIRGEIFVNNSYFSTAGFFSFRFDIQTLY